MQSQSQIQPSQERFSSSKPPRGPRRADADDGVRHARLVESAFDAIIAVDADGAIRAWNAAAERLYDLPEAAAVGQHISIIVPPQAAGEFAAAHARAFEGGRPRTTTTLRVTSGGCRVAVSNRMVAIRDETGTVTGVCCIERDAMADLPPRSPARLLADFPIPACLLDSDGTVKAATPAWTETFGWTRHDLSGRHFLDLVHPDQLQRAMQAFQAPHGTVSSTFVGSVRCKDGTDRHVECTFGAMRRKNQTLVVARDAGGEGAADHAETERLRARDEQLRQLVAGVAHELAGPLSAMKIQTFLLDRVFVTEDPRAAHAVKILGSNLERLQRLIKDLAELARHEADALPLEKQRVDLGGLMEDAAASFRDDGEIHGVVIGTDAHQGLWVEGDPGRLRQVLDNLLRNALKFTPRGGHVTMRTSRAEAGVVVTVQDTGRGLTPHEAGRLFEPFVQAHDPDEVLETGTGLGLYISRAIVERHEGRIWVESDGLGAGATFSFFLPSARQELHPACGET